MNNALIIAVGLLIVLALVPASEAKRRKAASWNPAPTLAVVVPDYCLRCQPVEFTLIEGTACDFIKQVCLLDDGTGQPNCATVIKSCD